MEYYVYINQHEFTFFFIIYGIFKYMPFVFQMVVFSFYLLLFVFCITLPLLLVECLTNGLYEKYGPDILKKRGCNTKAHASQKLLTLAACLICGQDTAGRVIAHGQVQNAWSDIQKANPNIPIPQPEYKGALDNLSMNLASIFDALRKKK